VRPAIFLDRDGVIIENRPGHVRAWSDVAFLPGALDALADLAASPYAVVVVTNQAAVGRGLLTLDQAQALNAGVVRAIRGAGGRIDAAYLCPHRPEEICACRKPRPGLLLRAARELDLCLSDSWIVGDALTDLQAARAAGARGVLVRTGRGSAQSATHGIDGVTDLPAALRQVAREALVPEAPWRSN
jgi:D-glycero-D-manno-heptose 1,7-bisphosphate phosphatase